MLRWHCHPILRLTTLSYQIISQLKNYFNFIHHPGFYVTVKVENTAATFNISGKHPSHLQRSAAVSVVIITLINYTHVIILSPLLSIVVSTQQARNGSTVHRMQHLTWYCSALSREMRLLEAWGSQNEESSCWLGDKLRLWGRLGGWSWCTQYELFRGDHLAQLFDIHWPRIQYLLESIAGHSFRSAKSGPQAHNSVNHSLHVCEGKFCFNM